MDYTDPAIAGNRIESMLALLRESTVGEALTPQSNMTAASHVAAQALEMQSPIDEFIHRSTQPSQAQQYLTFVAEASALPQAVTQAFESIGGREEPHRHDLNDDLALAQLLVNNGALFNGAVGGMQQRVGDATAHGGVGGLNRKDERERKLARIRALLKPAKSSNFDHGASESDESESEESELFDEIDAYMGAHDDGADDDDASDEADDDDAEFEESPAPAPAYGHYGVKSDGTNRRWTT